MNGQFVDRLDAGHQLAERLQSYRHSDAVVLGLARGGVIVAEAVAEALDLSLLALVVRKLGAPQNPELAIGAVSETGERWLDRGLVQATGATDAYVEQETQKQVAEARRRRQAYAVGPSMEMVRGRPAIVIDDGIATGATALVGAMAAQDLGAREVVVAAPVASPQAVELLKFRADRVVVLAKPDPFFAVGLYYQYFDQVTDEEVIDTLNRARLRHEVHP